MVPLLPKKDINTVFDLNVYKQLFWTEGEVGEYHSILIKVVTPGQITCDDGSQKRWILFTHGKDISSSLHPLGFMYLSMCGKKSGADFSFTQISSRNGMHFALVNAYFLGY